MRDIRMRAGQFAGLSCVAMLLTSLPGWSQQAQQETTDDAEQSALVVAKDAAREEIIVTARKREESLQEVPLSITALTSQGLRDRNIQNTYDLANATPNFSMTRNIGRRLEAPTIRGQFGTLLNITGPNASFFVDGAYVSGTSSNLSSNYVERVEVLRGPQAALFGRATFSGAINYITRKPGDELEGEVNLKVGEDERYEASVWASGPLIGDTLLGFASVGFQTYGGEWRNNLQPGDVNASSDPTASQDFFNGPGVWAPNVIPGNDCPPGYLGGCPLQQGDNSKLGGEETVDFSGKLLWNVNDIAEITAKVDYIETDDDHYPALFVPIENLNCFRPADALSGFEGDSGAGAASPGWFCGQLGPDSTVPSKLNLPDFRTGLTTLPPSGGPISSTPAPFIGTQSETTRYLLKGVIDLSDWELTTRAGYTDVHDEFVRDLDRTYALGPVATGLFEQYSITETEDKSFEIRLASPADKRIYGLIGYYYFEEEESGIIRDFNGFGIPDIDGMQTAKNRQYVDTKTLNNAFFGSINFELNSEWSASIDARYAKDTLQAKTNPPVAIRDAGQITFQPIIAKENFYSFTPRYIIKYQPQDNLNFYAQAAKGNKPGGYNTFSFFDADTAATDTLAALGENDCDLPGQQEICGLAVIDEEEAWTYEIGAKTTLFDNQLILNGNLYYIDWTNQQINVVVNIPTNCLEPPGPDDPTRNCVSQPNNIIDNVGQSEVFGIELEANWLATENLTFSLAYGMADSELKDFSDITLANLKCPAECWDTEIVDSVLRFTDEALALRNELGSVDGNASPRSPKHQLNVSGTYNRGISSSLEWFLRSDVTWESKQYARVSNLTYTDEPLIWNGWTGVRTDDWTLSFYINNILDDDTSALNNDFPLFDISQSTKVGEFGGIPLPLTTPGPFFDTVYPTGYLVTPRQGRNVGVTFQYSFGNF